MTRTRFDLAVAAVTIVLAFAVVQWMPHADRRLVALTFAAAGLVLGTLLWKRMRRA